MTEFSEAAERVAAGADHHSEAAALVAMMTVEEKLGCLDGDLGYWTGITEMMAGYGSRPWPAAHVDRLGIPGLDFADGPRGCVIGAATPFPVPMARGAAFDPELEESIGVAIGAELRASGATYTGAVCMNLLRHPGWGRAQETYGEDPHHVGEMAAAFTRGLQEHVMACMKHFALNSIENARFKVDVTADERALHEVYLPHFKRVADEGVASVMSAYNQLNGEWCGENPTLLTTILREEWGWDGFVITDFILGLRDPVKSVGAGLNIEMPFGQQRAVALPDAIEAGELDLADVDARVTETVATFLRFARIYETAPPMSVVASPEHRRLARRAAVESTVMLRNTGLLPVVPDETGRVAVLGRLATEINLGDAGSSNVAEAPDPVTPLAGITARFANSLVTHDDTDTTAASNAELVVVVVGYTKHDEGEYIGGAFGDEVAKVMPPMDHPVVGISDPSVLKKLSAGPQSESGFVEGGDRDSLRLRPEDEELIAAAVAVSDNVVVAVIAGSAVVVPWLDSVPVALMCWYGGVEGGAALAEVLCGADPAGRLPFAVPTDPDHLVHFDKDADAETYELLHGQWHLDANDTPAHLPFGFGLSYTSFELTESRVDAAALSASTVVTNTGDSEGSTVVQVYASVPNSAHARPPKRLVGFQKLRLGAGETQAVNVSLNLAALDIRHNGAWITEEAEVAFAIGFDAANATPV